jgi:hypothetical protein
MRRTTAIVAVFRDRLVETSRMDKRCVVQLTEYHKADLLTRTGRCWELIDNLANLGFRPQIRTSQLKGVCTKKNTYPRAAVDTTGWQYHKA